MSDNSTFHSIWRPELLLATSRASPWLTAASILTAALYLFYSRLTTTKRNKAQHLTGKRDLLGRISQLRIHPIKSCAGIELDQVKFGPEGLENDRSFLIVDAKNNRFITARKAPKMVLIQPTITSDPSARDLPLLEISFPAGSDCPSFRVPIAPPPRLLKHWQLVSPVTIWTHTTDAYISRSIKEINTNGWLTGAISGPSTVTFYPEDDRNSASSILSKYMGYPVHLVYKGPTPRMVEATSSHPELPKTTSARFQDGYPFLVASVESLHAVQDVVQNLAKEVGSQLTEDWKSKPLEMARFRPNIVFRSLGKAFVEDEVEDLVIDRHHFTLVSRCARCMLPNIDPSTGVMDKVVPSTALAKFRKDLDPHQKNGVLFGCNGITLGSGVLQLGDSVYAVHDE